MLNLVKKTNTGIVEVLQSNSKVLKIVMQDFYIMLQSHERTNETSIQITCFVEELPIIKVGKSFMVRKHITFQISH